MDVETTISYLYDGQGSEIAASEDNLLHPQANADAAESHTVTVKDGRAMGAADPTAIAAAKEALLEGCGYFLASHPSAVTDWYDETQVSEIYYAEAAALVQQIFGPAAHVLPGSGHILRDEKPLIRDAALQAPALSVHNDFAPSYVKNFESNAMMGPMLKTHRLVCLNLWRSIAETPMVRMPLALCDRRSIVPEDVRPVVLGPGGTAGGHEIMVGSFSPAHEWVYFPKLTKDEVISPQFPNLRKGDVNM